MAENTSTYTLNLDAEQFTTAANKAAASLTSVGEAGESILKLVETLEHMSLAVGVLTVALLAVDKLFESVFESEKIKQTEEQFDSLAKAAGLYPEALKKGLEEASKGWVDETELMGHANKALTELETGTEKLPEVMELARKATARFGGDFMQNFDAMAQAVASGNTRQLRHLGIVIDQQKAYRDYAMSIGTTVDALSLAGRQQAVMNALLEQGSEKFKGSGDEILKATSLARQFQAALKDIGEAITLGLGKLAEWARLPAMLETLAFRANQVKIAFKDWFGSGSEQQEAHLTRTKDKMSELYGEIQRVQQRMHEAHDPRVIEVHQKHLDDLRAAYNRLQGDLKKTEEAHKHLEETEKAGIEKNAQVSKVNLEAQKKQRAEFAKDMAAQDRELAAINRQNTQEEMKSMASIDKANELYNKKRLEDAAQVEAQITAVKAKQQEIRAKAAQGQITHTQELAEISKTNQQIVQLNKLKDQKLEQDDAELARMQKQALDNYVAKSQNAADAVVRAWSAAAQKEKMAISDASKFGIASVNAFQSNASSALQAWGAHTKSATDAAKGAFYGMIGDVSLQYGEMLMIAGIGSLNPAEAAAGGALIALSGYLKSIGGPGASVSSGGTFASGGLGSTGATSGNGAGGAALPTIAAGQTQNVGPGVHLVIQGSVFDSEATRTRIADLVRQAQDSTDFSIAKVGGGV